MKKYGPCERVLLKLKELVKEAPNKWPKPSETFVEKVENIFYSVVTDMVLTSGNHRKTLLAFNMDVNDLIVDPENGLGIVNCDAYKDCVTKLVMGLLVRRTAPKNLVVTPEEQAASCLMGFKEINT